MKVFKNENIHDLPSRGRSGEPRVNVLELNLALNNLR